MPNVVGHISQIIGPVVDVHFEMRAQQEKMNFLTFTTHCPSREKMAKN